MSAEAWWITGLLTVTLGLGELARRLERTDLHVYLRNTKQPPKHNVHFHNLGYGVSFPCDDERCPERTEP